MERIPESMSDDENQSPDSQPRRYSRSPQSPLRMSGTPTIRMRTPRGSVIYNPFHRDVMRKLSSFTCSPGTFSTPPARHHEGTQPFAWSPNIKGDLFPEDIDENPTCQFQLQEQINSQFDEEAQSFIGSFFNSQLVVPSPCDSTSSRVNDLRKHVFRGRYSIDSPLPRSSTETEGVTPTGRKLSRHLVSQEVDVGAQTDICIPPSFDLLTLLPESLHKEGTVTRGEPYEARGSVCSCQETRDMSFRRSLFSPVTEDEPNRPLTDFLQDFDSASPDDYTATRLNSSFEAERLASPNLSPISSPNVTLNMDTGYASHLE